MVMMSAFFTFNPLLSAASLTAYKPRFIGVTYWSPIMTCSFSSDNNHEKFTGNSGFKAL